ncbi:unnamed protein product [Effrenium voratum]|uniref:Helicase C-terminal domain-containing protein n=1 Tax=Effrenium voratum TaxID=2562239 RepID=A0AA36MSY3_9DINO|nr:unnamed protein product [Effrenium voratum]
MSNGGGGAHLQYKPASGDSLFVRDLFREVEEDDYGDLFGDGMEDSESDVEGGPGANDILADLMADPTVRNLTLDLLKPTHLLQKAKDELLSQMREERARQMEKRDAESKLQAISADIARQEDIIREARAHPSVRKRMHDSSQLRPGDKVVLKDDEEGRALTVLEVLPPEPLPPGPLRFQATSGMASTQVVAVEIQRSAAFKITGFNGSTMTSLKAFTKALCWTENTPHNGMAKVIIRGSHKQVELCKKVVNGLVDGSIRPQDLAQLAQISAHGPLVSRGGELLRCPTEGYTCRELAGTRGPEFRSFPPRSATNFSGKCEKLHELLESILSAQPGKQLENDKVLVFSSHINTIHMLEQQISEKWNTKVGKILGSMTNEQREEAMEIFQTDPGNNVMLISLQAGGVGVTLTAASHVVHFDRCYNPAKENQATDRAHRIGQTKTVFVHRLTCKDTFEERLAQIMEMKQRLSDWTVQSGEGWIADLGNAELRELFALGGQGTAPRVKRSREVLED